ncbi:hypothetical protein FGIG_09734 [Fasciola gigantica]|uniref:C-type lectin domain-containing protein n=1 Tax=Fasciola gigantica TaxID=46835 RepID=A0A504YJK7_FASGI|nr:hypothetical protein FGIG_09734 [Fasciola gigantica]
MLGSEGFIVFLPTTFLFLLFEVKSELCQANCPRDFLRTETDLCMIGLPSSLSYCAAHERCLNEGRSRHLRLFMVGWNQKAIPKYFPQFSVVPTSITALLNRSDNLREGWRVGDPGRPGFVTGLGDLSISWQHPEPNRIDQCVAVYISGNLHDNEQSACKSTGVVCEISRKPWSKEVETFQQNWPYQMPTLFLPDKVVNEGCFFRQNARSLLSCAKMCKIHPACRTIYFNSVISLCALSLYVDSLLPAELQFLGNTWTRDYGKQQTTIDQTWHLKQESLIIY